MKARFTAHFTRDITAGTSKATRTFKGTITVKQDGDHFVDAVIGALHCIAKEENLTGINRIDLKVGIIKPRKK
jgi:hypothetical protein